MPSAARRRRKSSRLIWFCAAMLRSASCSVASATRVPVSGACWICASSLISRSSTSRANCAGGGSAAPCLANCCRIWSMRWRTSLLVMGSELTSATMKSAVRTDVAPPLLAAGIGKDSAPPPRGSWTCAHTDPASHSPATNAAARHREGTRRSRAGGSLISVIVFKAAGHDLAIAQGLVAGDAGAQGLQGTAPETGKAGELQLEHDALVVGGRAGLAALQHDAPEPAAGVVLETGNDLERLLVGHAIVDPPDGVPLARAKGLAIDPLGQRAQQVRQGPLPADIDLLAHVALHAIGEAEHPVVARRVAHADGLARGFAGFVVELDVRVQ